MHDDPLLFDWTNDFQGNGPTWLEVVASHTRARALPAMDNPERLEAASETQGAGHTSRQSRTTGFEDRWLRPCIWLSPDANLAPRCDETSPAHS